MGKKSKKRDRRDTSDIATTPVVHGPTHGSPVVTTLEDRRQFHPEGSTRPAASLRRSDRSLKLSPKSVPRSGTRKLFVSGRLIKIGYTKTTHRQTRAKLEFNVPERVSICAKRAIRKATLHALKRTGGRGKRKPPTYKWHSKIGC